MANKNRPKKPTKVRVGWDPDLNKHSKNCDCPTHAKQRADERVKLWQQHGAAAPVDPRKTVFVRSFWRAQKNHYNKLPNTRNELVARLRALARAVRR